METNYFTDLTKMPGNEDLKNAIGDLFPMWMDIRNFAFEKYPAATEEWYIAVKKYGWLYRIKDKKRAIIYLSPRAGYFVVSMVFGQKATDRILSSKIAENIKTELMNSKVYMEGRVLRFDIHNNLVLPDLKELVEIKIAN